MVKEAEVTVTVTVTVTLIKEKKIQMSDTMIKKMTMT